MRTRGFTLIELMIVVVVIGVLAAIAIPNFLRVITNSKEAAVKSNSHTVQVASEDFCVQNDAVYAADLGSVTSMTGETIIDLLPKNSLMQNPFSGGITEPVNGAAAAPGETGYEPVVDGSGTIIGYIITGYGKTALITRLSNGQ